MKLYEFQAKTILKSFGVCVPRGGAISQSSDASRTFRETGASRCVVKAQVFAGGRGKSGAIQFAGTPEEARTHAAGMLGARLVTYQTGPQGVEIKHVLIEEAVSIKRELYLAVMIDRSLRKPIVVACSEGGVEIEEVAKKSPDKIIKEPVDILFGIHPFQMRRIASRLNMPGTLSTKLHNLIASVWNAFLKNDCSLLEINPLVVTATDEICALDAKMDVDDNALYRHPECEQFLSYQDVSPAEAIAKKYRLSYISLDGTIGCLVNGAGLAMATMDIIKLHGGEPANFLDVGGDASLEQVTQAFKIILSDPKVRAILINIFGGIMKCDIIASGIIQAIKDVGIHIPLVVRLEGTNVEAAKHILDTSGLRIISAKTMNEAADLVVTASGTA